MLDLKIRCARVWDIRLVLACIFRLQVCNWYPEAYQPPTFEI